MPRTQSIPPSPIIRSVPILHTDTRGPLGSPPVLLVHGICASTSYWNCRLGELEESYRCTAMDLLGHGKSPKPGDSEYSLTEQADAVEPILKRLAAQSDRPIPIIAHSMGNLVSLELRRRHPELIGPIFGMGMPYFPSRDHAYQAFMKLNPFATLPVKRPWYAGPIVNAARYSRGKVGFEWFNKNYGLPRDCWEDGFAVTWTSLSRTLHNLILDTDVDKLLEQAGSHDLEWFHGTHDQSAPYSYVQELWKRHPHVPTTAIQQGNHNVWIQKNADFTKLLAARMKAYYDK